MTDNKDVATSWLEGLAARGVSAIVTNGRLRILPSSAYKSLTDEELIALRHHRAAIKAAIVAGVSFDVVSAAATAEQASPAPAPETCTYGCGSVEECAALQARALDVWRVLHFADPEEVARRDEYHRAVMMKTHRGHGATTP
ncbi:MAG TPA: hypothetical protein VMU73_04305 [Gaiellaceae bacterium]|nr:hypothetical protein [Gaiellaceae bacterium]